MATPFGFSAGDIAMAIKFIGQVANALKESGGAASDFREMLQYLEGLLLTLQHLQRLDTSSADPSLVNAVRALTAAAEQPVRDFVEEMGKFRKAMVEGRSVASGYRKVEWAVVAAKKADKLRLKIAAQMQPIQLLMESQTLHCFDAAAGLNEELRSEVKQHAAQQIVFNQKLLDTLTTLQKSVEKANPVGNGSTPPIPKEEELSFANSSASTNSVEELKRLGEQLCVVLWHLLKDLRHLIALILLVSPQLLSQLHIWYQSIMRAPGWLLDENIHFENALGEMRSLPFAWFRDIRVFETFLEVDFENKPGEFQVTLHHYQILTPSGLRLDRTSWTSIVRPGGHIHMSINIPRNVAEILPGDDSAEGERVQRIGAERERKSKSAIWLYKTCPDCGLQFFAMPKLEPPLYRSHNGPPTTLLSGGQDYHGEHGLNPDIPRKPRSKRHRLLALDSGDNLPFKRMHIFGRARRRSRHSKPDLYAEPTLQTSKENYVRGQDSGLLQYGKTRIIETAAESKTMETLNAGGGTVDIALHQNKHTSDQESAYHGTTSHVRCDDSAYHIRPIISMVTMKEKVLSWFSKSKQRPKQPSAQTLTCQFDHCNRTFEGWKELNQHLRDGHDLDVVVADGPPGRTPLIPRRIDLEGVSKVGNPPLPDISPSKVPLCQPTTLATGQKLHDQGIASGVDSNKRPVEHNISFRIDIPEEENSKRAPSSVEPKSGEESLPVDYLGYDSDDYWVGC